MSGFSPQTLLHYLHRRLLTSSTHAGGPHASHELLVNVRKAIRSADFAMAESLLSKCEERELDPESIGRDRGNEWPVGTGKTLLVACSPCRLPLPCGRAQSKAVLRTVYLGQMSRARGTRR
jgi:hypothetical protein